MKLRENPPGRLSLVQPVQMNESDAEDVPYPPDLPAGAKVIYIGAEDVRLLEHLVVEHPGVISGTGEKHADVRWVDKHDWFVNEGIFDPRDLTVIDDHDFTVRAEQLRRSDWPGFSAEAPGNRCR